MTLCLIALAAAPVAADASAHAETEQLFRDGRALINLGKIDPACEKFEQSRALEQRSGIVLALADCRERQRRFATAWELFVEAKALAVREKREPSIALAERRAKEIAGNRAFLTVAIPESHRVPGLVVTRNGKDVPETSWDQELPIDSGVYDFEARATGYNPLVLHVEVMPQGKVTITVPALTKRVRRDQGLQPR